MDRSGNLDLARSSACLPRQRCVVSLSSFTFAMHPRSSADLLPFLTTSLTPAIPKARQPRLGWIDLIGLGIWLGGFGLEVAADRQKSAWRKARNEKKHEEKFISSGVWSWSRHPNYVGEVTLWTGVYVLSVRALLAASSATSSPIALKAVAPLLPRWVVVAALISPVFEYLLLTKVSLDSSSAVLRLRSPRVESNISFVASSSLLQASGVPLLEVRLFPSNVLRAYSKLTLLRPPRSTGGFREEVRRRSGLEGVQGVSFFSSSLYFCVLLLPSPP